jgi:prolyl oligopeptidase
MGVNVVNLVLRSVLLLAFALMEVAVTRAAETTIRYPETRRVDQTDEYHGVQVADPYRWLEADVRESEEVADWVAAQNGVARAYLDAIPERAAIRKRLEELWNFERFSTPEEAGGRYFFLKNDGLQNQAVLYWDESCDGAGRVLLDPNSWAKDGTIALGQTQPTEDGRLLAYARQEAGSDWVTLHVVEVATGRRLPDELQWSRFGNIVWNAAGDGFYYSRYPEPPEGAKHQAPSINQAIYFHKLGEPQAQDVLVYNDPENPTHSFWLARTEDDRYLVLSIARSTDPQNKLWIRAANDPQAQWTKLVDDFDHEYGFIGNDGPTLYFLTDRDAPSKRIVTIDADSPATDRDAEIVAAAKATLEGATLVGDRLFCSYLEDVATRVEIRDLDGKSLGTVPLPGVGSAAGFEGRREDRETFFVFTSYTTPSSIFRYDVDSGEVRAVRRPKVDFDPSLYESRLDFCTSKDGTRVPVIVSCRRGTPRDGRNPTLLYAYGGFNISITPAFSVEYAAWMERGGVIAVANLRGGGEYGETWHQAGKKQNKQNVFDDFLAAAQWLVAEKYTSPEYLGVMGGSNGGLLVGAVETQRPELFGACVPAVGVMDMLRFDQFTAGHFWRDEYGSSEVAEEFPALRAYSPYHNVKPGVRYPPTLVVTADTDDRVVPMHSFKYAAALQHAQAGDAPILLRIETRAGHGSGLPISKRIDQSADTWSFLAKTLGASEGEAASGQ